jgi:hypothetical protein
VYFSLLTLEHGYFPQLQELPLEPFLADMTSSAGEPIFPEGSLSRAEIKTLRDLVEGMIVAKVMGNSFDKRSF